MAHPAKLLMISDSLFLDQQQARRTAFQAMVEHIAGRTGATPDRVAGTLETVSGQATPHPPSRLVDGAMACYLARRTQGTRPPEGLEEALRALRDRLRGQGSGGGEHVVGVSALPPAALEGYAGGLKKTFDALYSAPAGKLGNNAVDMGAQQEDWIRPLPRTAGWPSPAVMRAVCALHHANPQDSVLLTGDGGTERDMARQLGIRTVQVRTDREGAATGGRESGQAPARLTADGAVAGLRDLPHLPLFGNAAADGRPPIVRPGRER